MEGRVKECKGKKGIKEKRRVPQLCFYIVSYLIGEKSNHSSLNKTTCTN